MTKHTNTSGSKRLIAAAVAALIGSAAAAAPATAAVAGVTPGVNNISGVTTRLDFSGASTVNNVLGASANASQSPYTAANKYTVNYGGNNVFVKTVTSGTSTYLYNGVADNVVDRFVGPNNDMLWYTGTTTGSANGSTVNLDGPQRANYHSAFLSDSLNIGADNLFSTKATGTNSNPIGNTTNVDRVDLLFYGGFKSSPNSAFAIVDRGNAGDHDQFAVAAITSLDSSGNPSSYGPLLRFSYGSYAPANFSGSTPEVVLRENNNVPNDTLHPSDTTTQGLGGVTITTAALAGTTGETIYGYSLFSDALNVTGDGSGTQLVNYTDPSVYSAVDSSPTGGGLDPAATVAVLFQTTAVPEPATATVLTTSAAGLLLSRRRKGASRRGA